MLKMPIEGICDVWRRLPVNAQHGERAIMRPARHDHDTASVLGRARPVSGGGHDAPASRLMSRLLVRIGMIIVIGGLVIVGSVGIGAGARAWAASPSGPAGATLQAVRAHGQVRCGVAAGLIGFSEKDASGNWVGFNVDYCRAVAAAVFGDAGKVTFLPFGVQPGLGALARGEIDILNRNVTITLRRVNEMGVAPVGVTFFDGQGFLVRQNSGIRTLRGLSGRSICFQTGTGAEETLKEALAARRILFIPIPRAGKEKELVRTFLDGGCDAISADASALLSIRQAALPNSDQYVVLRQRISKEPFGPFVRKGDDGWLEIARWTLMAMIEAEELGVSRTNVEPLRASDNPRIRLLLGTTPGLGPFLGLDDRWAYRILAEVGNYGDSFEANLGRASPLKLDRGLNDVWIRGGLLFALPLR